MAHFAEIDQNGIVQRVLVVSQEFIDTGKLGNPANWIQTSYNTVSGKYVKGSTEQEKLSLKLSGTAQDIAARNRKHFAGIGYKYDKVLDAFIPPKPLDRNSWILDKEMCNWKAPKDPPKDGRFYDWNEDITDWELADIQP